MAGFQPLWPPFEALDDLWQSPQGQLLEAEKARRLTLTLKDQILPRPRALILGAVSQPVQTALTDLGLASLIQAYPSALGARPGSLPSLLMDLDLPPFAGGHFDLLVVSHSFEYRHVPLALLSLAYEITQAQGRLVLLLPHPLLPYDLRAGQGRAYWGWQLPGLFAQAAFTPRGASLVRLAGWRPAYGIHLAQPQVPPRPNRPVVQLNPLEVLRRLRAAPGLV